MPTLSKTFRAVNYLKRLLQGHLDQLFREGDVITCLTHLPTEYLDILTNLKIFVSDSNFCFSNWVYYLNLRKVIKYEKTLLSIWKWNRKIRKTFNLNPLGWNGFLRCQIPFLMFRVRTECFHSLKVWSDFACRIGKPRTYVAVLLVTNANRIGAARH